MILAMREIQHREADLKITKDEWFTAWMLGRVKKRKKINSFNPSEMFLREEEIQ